LKNVLRGEGNDEMVGDMHGVIVPGNEIGTDSALEGW
jgi:hypothetical protein